MTAPMPEGMANALPAGVPPVTWPVFSEVAGGWLLGTTFDREGTAFAWTLWARDHEWDAEVRSRHGSRRLHPSDTHGYGDDQPARLADCARMVARMARRVDEGMVFRPLD